MHLKNSWYVICSLNNESRWTVIWGAQRWKQLKCHLRSIILKAKVITKVIQFVIKGCFKVYRLSCWDLFEAPHRSWVCTEFSFVMSDYYISVALSWVLSPSKEVWDNVSDTNYSQNIIDGKWCTATRFKMNVNSYILGSNIVLHSCNLGRLLGFLQLSGLSEVWMWASLHPPHLPPSHPQLSVPPGGRRSLLRALPPRLLGLQPLWLPE